MHGESIASRQGVVAHDDIIGSIDGLAIRKDFVLNIWKLALLVVILLGVPIRAEPAAATELEVTHWWTSDDEVEAIKVIAKAFHDAGHVWLDNRIEGKNEAQARIANRILGGDPMGATLLELGDNVDELIRSGYLTDLTELAEEGGWEQFFRPSHILDQCRFRGRIYCIPFSIESFYWMWLDRDAFERAGFPVPKDWNELVDITVPMREKGIVPLAVAGTAGQIARTARVFLASLAGPDLYRRIYVGRDATAARDPEVTKVFSAIKDMRIMVDEGYRNRSWQDTFQLVRRGYAGAQIVGGSVQIEFTRDGKVGGKDYECLPGLGVHPVVVPETALMFFPRPYGYQRKITDAQLVLASLLVSKLVQLEFGLKKGSLPIRSDIEIGSASYCMKKGLEVLEDPTRVLPTHEIFLSADAQEQINQLWFEFFSDPGMAAEDAQEQFAQIVENNGDKRALELLRRGIEDAKTSDEGDVF